MESEAIPTVERSAAAQIGAVPPPARSRRGRRRAPRRPAGSRHALVTASMVWLALVAGLAIFADLLPLKPIDVLVRELPARHAPHLSLEEPLGTDSLGRSTLSRLVYGGRQSLAIGVIATMVAMAVGLAVGITAGYVRGALDAAIGVVIDSMLSVPALVMLLALTAVGRRNVTTVIIGLAIIGTPYFARLARASTISFAARAHITAARSMGARTGRIVVRELLPDVIMPVSTFAFLFMSIAIIAEASLSFLGLGVPPPTPSWGGMVNEGRRFLENDPHLVYVPSLCLLFTALALSTVGDHARRRFDTRESALR